MYQSTNLVATHFFTVQLLLLKRVLMVTHSEHSRRVPGLPLPVKLEVLFHLLYRVQRGDRAAYYDPAKLIK